MHITNLRKVGGSVMLTVPPAILDLLHLSVGESVGMSVTDGRLVIKAAKRPRYSLAELLSQCEGSVAMSAEDREWLEGRPVGSELL